MQSYPLKLILKSKYNSNNELTCCEMLCAWLDWLDNIKLQNSFAFKTTMSETQRKNYYQGKFQFCDLLSIFKHTLSTYLCRILRAKYHLTHDKGVMETGVKYPARPRSDELRHTRFLRAFCDRFCGHITRPQRPASQPSTAPDPPCHHGAFCSKQRYSEQSSSKQRPINPSSQIDSRQILVDKHTLSKHLFRKQPSYILRCQQKVSTRMRGQ